MESLIELKDRLGEASGRYEVLKSNFQKFHTLSKAQIENPTINIKEITITPIINNEFDVELANHKVRFKFSTAVKRDILILIGYIDCFVIDSDGKRQLNLREFEFKCNGISSYKAAEIDENELNITNDNDALRIVLYFLYKSIGKR